MEQQYVHDVYDRIAHQFDKTRHSQWKCVKSYLESFKHRLADANDFSILDVGCGNGKYVGIIEDVDYYGLDSCAKLLQIATSKANEIEYKRFHPVQANATSIPFQNAAFDVIISIACLHHIYKQEDRIKYMKEIARVLKPQQTCMITVWAREQEIPTTWRETAPNTNDFMIPWFDKSQNVYLDRYYHLFTYDECVSLVLCVHELSIVSIINESNNWVMTLTKCTI